MKAKDITTIIIIGIVSAVLSGVISSKVFVTPSSRQQVVEVIPTVQSSFNQTDVQKYLSPKSIDPTVKIEIGTTDGGGKNLY
ncbi:MAG: hypothetical protein WCG30_00750 [Candidatus Saccharibacteria bacterium]